MNLYSMAIIKTKYLPCTDTRGSRIKATCQAGSVSIPYDHSLSGADLHWEAVKALLAKLSLDWGDEFTIGSDNNGYYFIPTRGGNNIAKIGG